MSLKILIPIVSNTTYGDTDFVRSLYEIKQKTILEHVYNSMSAIQSAEYIVIVHRRDVERSHLDDMIRLMIPNVEVVISEGKTKGAACSCLLASDYFEESDSLIIMGGNQLIVEDTDKITNYFINGQYDGGIVIFDDIHPRWSFAKLSKDGEVIETAVKRPISRNAVTGFYYFRRGSDFIESVQNMIKKDDHCDGQFCVITAYNEMILANKRIGAYRISKDKYFYFDKQDGLTEYEKYLSQN